MTTKSLRVVHSLARAVSTLGTLADAVGFAGELSVLFFPAFRSDLYGDLVEGVQVTVLTVLGHAVEGVVCRCH